MKKLPYIFFLLFWCEICVAQTSLRQAASATKDAEKQSTHKTSIRSNTYRYFTTSKSNEVRGANNNDTIYCSRTKKQHGWFAPMDTISKKVARHCPCSFRFTNKNKAGHWGKMEVIDGYGNYVEGTMAPYIQKLGDAVHSDKGANTEWIDKLKTTCIYEFVSDFSGETIVEEIAKDKNNNIIYTYSRVSIGNNQYNGSYRDHNGLPTEMRPEDSFTYGTLVRITEDRWGNDSVIQYIDAKGLPKLNSDSAAMEVYICDEYGHILKQQSRDINGNLVIDNWGNCGIEYVWNASHNIVSATYMDTLWHPMRMPSLRAGINSENVYRVVYEYDKFGRRCKEFYVLPDGRYDENSLGTHSKVYKYDDKGNYVSICGYNIKGNPSPVDESMAAIQSFSYNENGKLTKAVFLNPKGNPCNTIGYLSKVCKRYDDKGSLIETINYSAENGVEEICYKNIKGGDYEYSKWNDGSCRIDSFDHKGRLKSIEFFDKYNNRMLIGERARETNVYYDESKTTTCIETNYGVNNEMVDVNGICKTISIIDSLNWTKTNWRYNAKGELKETYIHRFDEGFVNILAQDDANSFGAISRSGGSASVRYYRGNISYRVDGGFAGLYGRDEFDEPDYTTSNTVTYCYQKHFPNAPIVYYDANNNPIDDMKEFKDGLPKAMTIEVVDSAAYERGLRDNDIIILYGNYTNNLDSIKSYYDFRKEWSIRSVLDANEVKRMVVFRIEDASKNKFGLVEIKDLKGTCSDLGFMTHIRYLTDRQVKRIQNVIKENVRSSNSFLSESDISRRNFVKGDNYIILGYVELFRSIRNMAYPSQITDPSILLGSCIVDRKMKWTGNYGENTDDFSNMLITRKNTGYSYPTQKFYLTKDVKSIIEVNLDSQYIQSNWFDAYISDEDYAKISPFFTVVENSIKSDFAKQHKTISAKKLCGCWRSCDTDKQSYKPEIDMRLSKDGTLTGKQINYAYIDYYEGRFLFKVETDLKGTWSNGGGWLFFYPDDKNVNLNCIDITAMSDENLRKKYMERINQICETDKNKFLSEIKYFYPCCYEYKVAEWSNEEIILYVSKSDSIIVRKISNIILNSNKNKAKKMTRKSLVGVWKTQFPGDLDLKATLTIRDRKRMSLQCVFLIDLPVNDTVTANAEFDVLFGGTWKMKQTGVMFKNDPNQLDFSMHIDVVGCNDDYKSVIIDSLSVEWGKRKERLASFLLQESRLFEGYNEIYSQDDNTIAINKNVWSRYSNVIICEVERGCGCMAENGYDGEFIVLEWCDWNVEGNLDSFVISFDKNRKKEKQVLLLPFEIIDGKDVFHDIVRVNCSKDKLLGLHIKIGDVKTDYFEQVILQTYKKYFNQSQVKIGF